MRRLGVGEEAGALANDALRAALTLFDSSDPRSPFVLLYLADARPTHHRYPGLLPACDEPYTGPCTAALPYAELLRLAPSFEERDFARLRALAASEVAAVDDALGALLDGLARRGLADQIVVAVVGTRGAWLGERGRVGLVPGLDPEVLHVPFVLRLPARISVARSGLALQGVVDLAVTTTELAPTLRAALELGEGGVDVPEDVPDDMPREAQATSAAQDRGATSALAQHGLAPTGSQLLERTAGRSVLPGASAGRRLLRFGSRRAQALAAVYTEGAGIVRDIEHHVERVVPFGGASLAEAERIAVQRGLGIELDAWLGPLPRAPQKSARAPRRA